MRPWRKLHNTILESERFMDMPSEAKVLFFLLVVAQDDSGYFPWERLKVRHLVASCSWTDQEAHNHAQALVDGDMASWGEGGIILRNGETLNGQPRDDRKPFLYQRHPTDTPVTDNDGQCHAIDDRGDDRGDDRERGVASLPTDSQKPTIPKKQPESITSEYLEELVVEFSSQLGGNGRVREIIEEAMNHKAIDKRKDKRLYLRGWLRRDVERTGAHGNSRTGTQENKRPTINYDPGDVGLGA